jgi:hypothetical protein
VLPSVGTGEVRRRWDLWVIIAWWGVDIWKGMTGEGCRDEDLWEVEVEVVVVAVGGREVVEGGECGFDAISNRGGYVLLM